MRFYSIRSGEASRLAVEDGGRFVDVRKAYETALVRRGECATEGAARVLARTLIPSDLRELIEMGAKGMEACREAVRFAREAAEPGLFLDPAADKFHIEAPLKTPRKFLCIGLNYKAHAAESGAELPKEPVFFNKFATSIVGPTDDVDYHAHVTQALDYEVELGVVIGATAKRVAEADAWRYVFGYTAVNDISARDLQKRDGQWVKGKALDTYAPLGPCVVTADEVDGSNLALRTKVNGELRQESNTNDLIFSIPRLVAYLSQLMTLEPGDIISTGTPSGVGGAMKPPRFLKPGDVVECEVEGIGVLCNRIAG